MRYVFGTEGFPMLLGEYVGVDEDMVVYKHPSGSATRLVSYDQSKIVEIDRADVIEVVERFERAIDSAKTWIQGPGGGTGLNSLVAIATEMIEYAILMGAALTPEQAKAVLTQQVESGGYYKVERAHAAKIEEATV